jgi:hypothetical protein
MTAMAMATISSTMVKAAVCRRLFIDASFLAAASSPLAGR